MIPIPYRIRTPRLTLRCWEPTDAAALCDAIAMSLDHLRAWVPWAMQEPIPPPEKIKQIQKWRSRFERGEDLFYGLFDSTDHAVIGGVGMHARIGAAAREIGYWVRVDRTSQGFATESAAAMTRIGFELLNLHRIEIHCDPRNLASAAVPRKLGYANQVTMQACVPSHDIGPRDTTIWSLIRSKYQSSLGERVKIEAFDVLDERIDPGITAASQAAAPR